MPELINESARWSLDIIERKNFVLRNGSPRKRSHPKDRWEERDGTSCRSIVDQSVSAKAADPVEAFAGFQIALGNRNHFANGTRDGGDSRIVMDRRAPDSRSDLQMREMERRVENIEWAFTELVIRKLSFFQRRFFVNDNKCSSMRSCAEGIVHKPCF